MMEKLTQLKMDRRIWPWKKKSSDKSAAEKAIATLDSASATLGSVGSLVDKEKKPKYVQISIESYTHLSELEEQVKTYEDQAKTYEDQVKTLEEHIDELNEKVSSAHSELTSKEELVKQHAKVAEEAVSGWEKAEAEALTLKNHLETVTLAKLTVEDKAAHLDDALKECMRQIRNLKEDHEQKLQEVVLTKNKQYDQLKHDLESNIANLDQELLHAAAENAALSRSLQECSNMLIKINEEKSRAEAEIELLKSNIESHEREINSLKYELHIVSKELEIRNEEKNMSLKTAEVANKQHLEGVKRITKLEAECQRLRGLVRKKLPGPAALAQMKLEVESLGRDHGETRLRRSPVKPSSPHFPSSPHVLSAPEFSLDGLQKFQKENEFFTERFFAMEEETKMLKEALAKRNSELQTSRSICAKTASKLQSLEAQMHAFNLQKGSPSMTSMSEDGNDDTVSCAESSASALISELTHIKEKNKNRSKGENGHHLELMDDFLEMEKLARSSNDRDESMTDISVNANTEMKHGNSETKSSDTGAIQKCPKPDIETLPLLNLQSRISKVFESVSNDTDVEKILEEIKHIVQEMHSTLKPQAVDRVFEEKRCPESAADVQTVPQDGPVASENTDPLTKQISRDLLASISQIHSFVLSLGKDATSGHGAFDDSDRLNHKIQQFSVTFNKVLSHELSLDDFISALSDVIAKASELRFNFLGYERNETEANSPDCIDKVALPENKTLHSERYPNGCGHVSDSSSNPEVPMEVSIIPGFESTSCKCSLEEYERMKAEKDNLENEFAKCREDLEEVKLRLQETEEQLTGVKSQFASSQKMNGLAETQLKCMAESYKTLEKLAEELEAEVKILKGDLESMQNELQAERTSHHDALARCKDLEEQLQRNERCSACSSSAADVDIKTKQEKELAAAAEKLAECQETIYLLGKQLKALHPQPEFTGTPHTNTTQKAEEPTINGTNIHDLDRSEMPVDLYNTPSSPSETELNLLRSPVGSNDSSHRYTKSGSLTPEKHSRGFSRFFSSKPKNSH